MIHVHDILHYVRQKGEAVTVNEIEARFGRENRFTNCREDNCSMDEIIQFMIVKGKVEKLPDGSIRALDIPACNH